MSTETTLHVLTSNNHFLCDIYAPFNRIITCVNNIHKDLSDSISDVSVDKLNLNLKKTKTPKTAGHVSILSYQNILRKNKNVIEPQDYFADSRKLIEYTMDILDSRPPPFSKTLESAYENITRKEENVISAQDYLTDAGELAKFIINVSDSLPPPFITEPSPISSVGDNFNVIYINSSDISEDRFNDYKNIMNDAFNKWNLVIHGVKNAAISNFKLNIEVSFAKLGANILGSAQLTHIYDINTNFTTSINYLTTSNRYGTSIIPHSGTFTINTDLIQSLYNKHMMPSNKTLLYYVALHEIGHLIGIGALFFTHLSASGRSGLGVPVTTKLEDDGHERFYYIGDKALQEYRYLLDDTTLIGVPIEDHGGGGTANVHLEEGIINYSEVTSRSKNNRYVNGKHYHGLDQELMTGISEIFVDMPLSRITIGLVDDLGYNVIYESADDYDGPFTPWAFDVKYYFNPSDSSTNNQFILTGECFIQDFQIFYTVYSAVIQNGTTFPETEYSHTSTSNIITLNKSYRYTGITEIKFKFYASTQPINTLFQFLRSNDATMTVAISNDLDTLNT